MDELKTKLEQAFPAVDFNRTDLIEGGVLDSITLVSLIALLEEEYDIEISMDYIIPENFESVEAMWNLVEELS